MITKRDGGVYMNGVLVPFVNPNDIDEGETDPRKIGKMILKAIKLADMKKGDGSWQSLKQ